MHYTDVIEIDAPCEEVFDYRLDLRNLPRYNADVSEVECLDSLGPARGARYAFRVRLAPFLHWPVRAITVRVDRPFRIDLELHSLMSAHEVCTFEPAGARGHRTRLSLSVSVDTRGGVLAPLVDRLFVLPATRAQVRRELEAIKSNLEQKGRAAPPMSVRRGAHAPPDDAS